MVDYAHHVLTCRTPNILTCRMPNNRVARCRPIDSGLLGGTLVEERIWQALLGVFGSPPRACVKAVCIIRSVSGRPRCEGEMTCVLSREIVYSLDKGKSGIKFSEVPCGVAIVKIDSMRDRMGLTGKARKRMTSARAAMAVIAPVCTVTVSAGEIED